MDHQQYNARTPEGLAETSQNKTSTVDQVSAFKKAALAPKTEEVTAKLDPVAAKQQDLNNLDLQEYQAKYGYNSDVIAEYANNLFVTQAQPAATKRKLQNQADEGTVLDTVADSALGVVAGGVGLVGNTAGLGLAVSADPLEAVVSAGSTIKEVADDFVGADTDYEALILGDGVNQRNGEDPFKDVKANVNEFLEENGVKQGSELNVTNSDGLTASIQNTLKDASGLVFEGTKSVTDWIKTGQSDALKAETQLRAQENENYRNELKQELGEDAAWYEHAAKNSKIIGNSFFNLLKDPASTVTMIAESAPSLLGAGAIASKVSGKSLDNALSTKTDELIAKARTENLSHANANKMIQEELQKVTAPISTTNAAAVASGSLEGAGAASEAYNLIIDTPFEVLEKASDTYKEYLSQGMNQEDARKATAYKSALGSGLAVMAVAGGITKVSGAADGINRAYGTVKTAKGAMPRAVQMTGDAAKEGIEETLQSFVGSVASGIVKRENVDPTTDVYGEAAIAAGEGALAGVGTSGAISTARNFIDGVNTAKNGSKDYVQKAAKSTRKARSIKDSGLSPADTDTTNPEFDFVATIQGIKARNNVEGVTPEEMQSNADEAGTVLNTVMESMAALMEETATGKYTPEQQAALQKKIDKGFKQIDQATNIVNELNNRLSESPEVVAKDIEEAVAGDKDAAKRSMNNINLSPSSVSEAQAKALLDSGNLDEAQVERVQNHLNIIEAGKTLDEVNSDVMIGGPGFIGIQQYINTISSSLRANNLKNATKSFKMLEKFATRHKEKAEDYTEGLALVQTDPRTRTDEQKARIAMLNGKYPNAKEGYDTFHNGSGRSRVFQNVVETIGMEANALADAVTFTQGSIDAVMNPTETTQEDPVEEPVETNTVEYVDTLDVDVLRNNPDKIYIFGDNLIGKGKGGQAVIRDEPNAVGIPTKRLPSMKVGSFFGKDIEEEKAAITKAVTELKALQDSGKTLVFPKDGLGTGRADLENKSPEVFMHLNESLKVLGAASNTVEPVQEGEVTSEIDSGELSEESTEVLEEDSFGSKFSDEIKGKKQGELRRIINRIEKDQEKRLSLLNSDNQLKEKAENVGETLNDMRKITEDNYLNNNLRLKYYKANLDSLPKESKISFGKTTEVTNNETVQEETINEPGSTEVTESTTSEPTQSTEQVSEEVDLQTQLDTAVANGDLSTAAQLSNEIDNSQAVTQEEDNTAPIKPEEYLGGKVLPKSKDDPTIPESAGSMKARYEQFLNENLVTKYFRVQNKVGRTENPITKVYKLMDTLTENADTLITKYTEVTEPTAEQKNLLAVLQDHHKDFSEELANVYNKDAKTFKNQDMVRYLQNDDGTLPEELLAAMSVATFNWVATSAGKTVFNTFEDIRQMLGLDKDDPINPEAVKLLSEGGFRSVIASEIGKNALKAMNLTTIKTAPSNMKTQLENSIGLLAIAGLRKQGMVQVEHIVKTPYMTSDELTEFNNLVAKYGDNPRMANPKKNPEISKLVKILKDTIPLIKVPTVELEDGSIAMHEALENMVEANKNTDSLLSKMFKVEDLRTGPVLKPVKSAPKKVKNTNQDVGQEYSDIIVKHNALKHTTKDAQIEVVNALGVDGVREMLGYVTDLDKVQVNRRKGVESKNRSINASLKFFNEAMDAGTFENDFYFHHDVTKNGRLRLNSNSVNPQTDKHHRHLIKIEGQESTINLKDSDPTQYNNLLIAFGQSMGISIDKMLQEKSLKIVKDLIETQEVKDAIEAINNLKDGEFTPEQKAVVLKAVEKGEEKTWSLDGLVALAGYQKAKELGLDTYTHDLMIEVDGITNGPGITTLQFGIGLDLEDIISRLNRIGINEKGNDTEYGEFIDNPANLDNYETLTQALNTALTSMSPVMRERANFILFLLGDLVEYHKDTGEVIKINRTISKAALMPFIYGSGDKALTKALGNLAIDEFYKYLEKNANNPEKLNKLVQVSKQTLGITFEEGEISQDALEYTLEPKVKNHIVNQTENSIGQAMLTAIDSEYSQFKERAKPINTAMGVVAETFQKVYEHAYSKRTQELVDQGILASKGNDPLELLPTAEETKILESLVEMQPIMQSVFSSRNNDATNEGLYVGKILDKVSDKLGLQTRQSYNDSSYPSASVRGTEKEYVSGGVSPVVTAVQNIDATTMAMLIKQKAIFNVYDAYITGGGNAKDFAKIINGEFFDINLNHSIMEEAVKAFNRAEQAVMAYDKENGTDFSKWFSQSSKAYNMKDPNEDSFNSEIRNELLSTRDDTIKDKARVMGIIGRVGQYGYEDGSFVVSNETVTLGNTPLNEGNQPVYKTETQRVVDSMSVNEVFRELGKLGNTKDDPSHTAYLAQSVNELRTQIVNPIKLHLRDVLEDTIANIEGDDIFMYTQLFGGAPGSTAIVNAGLRMSAQEAFAHELWHSVSRHGIEDNTPAKKELVRRWEQAKNTITPFDLMDDPTLGENSPEYKEAQKVWDYIFTPREDLVDVVTNPVTGSTQKKSYSNHLHEFAAFSMTNKKFMEALSKVPADAKRDAQVRQDDGSFLNSLLNKVLDLLGSVVDKLSTYMTNTKGLPQDQAVRELIKQISNIEGKNKNFLMSSIDTIDSYSGKISGIVGTTARVVTKPVLDIANSNFVKNNKNIAISLPGRIVRLASRYEQVNLVFDAMESSRMNLRAKKENFGEALYTEANGLTEKFKNFHTLSRLKTKMVDRAVVELQGSVETILTKAFGEVKPTEKELEAVTKAFLKTDLSSLGLSLPRIVNLLDNPSEIAKNIAAISKPLQNDPNFNHYELQVKALGYFMATGKVTSSNLNYNAKQIAEMWGTTTPNPNAKKVEKSIDMLASLYALKYTDDAYKARLSEFIKKNEATGVENGMEFLQRFHSQQKEKDLEDIFNGSETNMVKGHIRDIVDPNVKVVILNEEDGKEYVKRGWVRTELVRDPHDDTEDLHMYVDTTGGDTRTISSIISFTSKQARGTDTIKRRQVIGDKAPIYSGGKDANKIFLRKERAFKQEVAKSGSFEPSKAANRMAPLYDLQGRVTGYRYLMQDSTKDTLLQRNNNAIQVLAKGAGSTLNKVSSKDFNKKTIEALKAHYDEKPTGDYIEFGPNSKDPEVREIYARIPKDTKDDVQAIWGTKTMFVDKRVFTMLFGYRKFSVADQLAKDKADQHILIQSLGYINNIIGKPFNMSAEQVARNVGQYWQEYVSMVKDFLIIKSGIVTAVNTLSNSAQLYTEGLKPTDILKYQKEAAVEVSRYRQQMAELKELEKIVELGFQQNKLKQNNAKIARLRADITANPVTDIIEDGLLQSIVEDVSLVEDDFSKGGKLSQTLEKHVYSKVPGYVREVGREAFITHDSFLYKKMSQSAQLSDFMARYALYKHNTGKGMSRDDAANESISVFVNYDLPTHKSIQYLNDMGLVWFTKYYIRIQKILGKTFINNTARVLSLITLDFLSGDSLATVYDTYLSPENIGNRLGLPSPPQDLVTEIPLVNTIY